MQSAWTSLARSACAIAIGFTAIACGDDSDDTDINAQVGDDAAVSDSGSSSGGQTRAGSGGARANAGRGGGSTAGVGVPPVGGGGRSGGAGGGATPILDGGASPDAGMRLTDAQILAVTSAANTAEIQLGALALANAQLATVRDFAQALITAHSGAQERQAGLAQSLAITPVENSVSTQIDQEATLVASRLQLAAPSEFDASYVQSQIDLHTRVLALFDDALLPNVMQISLRTNLTLARMDIQEHLAQAKALLATIGQTPIDADAGVEDAGL